MQRRDRAGGRLTRSAANVSPLVGSVPDGLVADSQRQLRRGHLTFYPFQEHDVGWYVRVVDHDPVQLGDQALRLGTRSNGDDVIHPVPVVAEVGALPKFEEMVGEGGEIRPPVKIGGELETRPPSGLRFDSMSDHLGGVVVRAEDELMPT